MAITTSKHIFAMNINIVFPFDRYTQEMKLVVTHLLLTAWAIAVSAAASPQEPGCAPFPSSMVEFSANFEQPSPPLVKSEFNTSFVQHKWNQNLSHITNGYIQNSPSRGFVRAGEAFEEGVAISLFNYTNVTEDGLVDNTLTTYSYDSAAPDVWRGYVNSNFPVFAQDILVTSDAVFAGLVHRRFLDGLVAAWDVMYQGAIPVTIFVSSCNVVVGYDYFSPGLRTRVITEFFNIQAES